MGACFDTGLRMGQNRSRRILPGSHLSSAQGLRYSYLNNVIRAMKLPLRTTVLLLTVWVSPFSLNAVYEFYFSIEGSTQGQFKGESRRESRADTWMVGLGFEHAIEAPRDVATGRASGKRQHGPIRVTKEWGPATPQILQALATHEILPSVVFEFLKTDESGQEYVYYTIRLTNAVVLGVSQRTGTENTNTSARSQVRFDNMELETIELGYQRIEWESADGSTMATADWFGGGRR